MHSLAKQRIKLAYISRQFFRDCFLAKPVALIVALSLTLPAIGFGQTIWTDGTGDWFLGTNWSAGVPNSSTQAQVNNSGTAQITTSGAAAASVLLGWNDVSELGNLSIAGAGRLTVQQDLAVGGLGNGTLSIINGAQVSDFSGEVGYTITSHPGVSGNATVDGAGSSWTHASDLHVGYGTGALTISNGATVSSAFGHLATFGEFPGRSHGTVTVTGQSSAWTNSFDLWTGENGTGVLNISNGGSVSTIYFHHSEEDMQRALAHPLVSIGSDGTAVSAERAALAPGMGTTGTPRAIASRTSASPGSLIPGVPASVTSAT